MIENLTCMIDLHLHLDGAISVKSARELAKLQNIPVPESDAELKKLLTVEKNCADLNEFLERFAFPCSLLQTREALTTATYNLCEELKAQGVMYAEIRFAPQKHCEQGLTQQDAVEAAIAGVARANLSWPLILCCMRDADNRAENLETIDLCSKYLGKGVCAADLAGAEALYPTSDFTDIFAHATSLHVPFTIHAGEAAGPSSVTAALHMGATRIGHGIRATEDPSLLPDLTRTPLEICPSSNLATATIPDLDHLPLRTLLNHNIPITINTDDPSIEDTTIKREYTLLINHFHLTKPEVRHLLETAATSTFAPPKVQKHLLNQIAAEFGNL